MAENIEEILAEIDESQLEEYQHFFDMFDRSKNGYIMATQATHDHFCGANWS